MNPTIYNNNIISIIIIILHISYKPERRQVRSLANLKPPCLDSKLDCLNSTVDSFSRSYTLRARVFVL